MRVLAAAVRAGSAAPAARAAAGPGRWRAPLELMMLVRLSTRCGRGQRDALRDHAAHAGADHVRAARCPARPARRARRPPCRAASRAHCTRQAEAMAQASPHQVGHAQVVEVLRQADVAVVEAHDAKAGFCTSACTKRRRPGDQLHAQAHHQQHRPAAAGGRAGVLDLDRRCRWPATLTSKRRSRSHLVAIHFSPASTGAPPCSVRVDGCGRS